MAWAIPEHSRNQVDKAGFAIADPNTSGADLVWAYDVINNWRAAHSFPLNTFQMHLRGKIKRMKKGVLVAQRIKRLDSIISKIGRGQTSTIQLSQMQDIGGCRAVLPFNSDVRALVASYKSSKLLHKLKGEKDYITYPKPDGYRCHHLVYQYFGKGENGSPYDKLRIEIQLRTAQQHAWATALEAVGIFTRQALKSNQGSEDWLRFFALTSSAIAALENEAPVPGTPENKTVLIDELAYLAAKLDVKNVLENYGNIIPYVSGTGATTAKYYLVHLNSEAKTTRITRFKVDQSEMANEKYLELERLYGPSHRDQVVLVSVDSVRALRRAYPNYFIDTKRFVNLMNTLLVADAR